MYLCYDPLFYWTLPLLHKRALLFVCPLQYQGCPCTSLAHLRADSLCDQVRLKISGTWLRNHPCRYWYYIGTILVLYRYDSMASCGVFLVEISVRRCPSYQRHLILNNSNSPSHLQTWPWFAGTLYPFASFQKPFLSLEMTPPLCQQGAADLLICFYFISYHVSSLCAQ